MSLLKRLFPPKETLPYDIRDDGGCTRNAEGYRRIKAKLADPAFQQAMSQIMRVGAP